MQHSPYIGIALMLVGFAGFSVASYIYRKKHRKLPLVCPMNGNCDLVTHSTYSNFLGMPIERLGMVYYIAVFLFHAVVLLDPALATPAALAVSLGTVTAAFFFSLYLVSLQAFVIKQWCTWCVCSAVICLAIVLLSWLGAPAGIF